MASKRTLSLLRSSSKIYKPNVTASSITRTFASENEPCDKVTHTGQVFDKDDYRLVRFVNKEKQVNTQWAIDLIAEVPPTASKERIVACNGGGGPLGHPKVYINLDKPGNHICGYCGLRFYKEDHHH